MQVNLILSLHSILECFRLLLIWMKDISFWFAMNRSSHSWNRSSIHEAKTLPDRPWQYRYPSLNKALSISIRKFPCHPAPDTRVHLLSISAREARHHGNQHPRVLCSGLMTVQLAGAHPVMMPESQLGDGPQNQLYPSTIDQSWTHIPIHRQTNPAAPVR